MLLYDVLILKIEPETCLSCTDNSFQNKQYANFFLRFYNDTVFFNNYDIKINQKPSISYDFLPYSYKNIFVAINNETSISL